MNTNAPHRNVSRKQPPPLPATLPSVHEEPADQAPASTSAIVLDAERPTVGPRKPLLAQPLPAARRPWGGIAMTAMGLAVATLALSHRVHTSHAAWGTSAGAAFAAASPAGLADLTDAPLSIELPARAALPAQSAPAVPSAESPAPQSDEAASEAPRFQAEILPDVTCAWEPYGEGWACALPESFAQGRFGTPPRFRRDGASVAAREGAWKSARSAHGARIEGHVGAFVPRSEGGWLFVPGRTWSPHDPVYLPAKAKAR